MQFYIHMPFCIRKCLYCDFYSITALSRAKEYAHAVIEEMKKYRGMRADTVYIGGGTPTSAPQPLLEIVNAATQILSIEKNCEFTVEANPGTVDADLLKDLRKSGVNRLSLGAQSFNDNELKALGRIHTSREIFSAVEQCYAADFSNISLDLMLATPLQTMDSLSYSIECVKKLAVPHVSAYSLIIEENTPFYSMKLDLPNDDTEREMYYMVRASLAQIGIMQYEISNFSKSGFEGVHNSGYWQCKEYIGIGAGAHSYYNGERFCNAADAELYISGGGRKQQCELISQHESELERFMLGLRMTRGIKYNGEFAHKVEPLIQKGLLETDGERLRLTMRGIDLANIVFMEFTDD